ELAHSLERALREHGSVAHLTRGDLAAIDQAERDADRVVLSGDDAGWIELCLREADLVVAVTAGQPGREWLARATELQGCELIVAGRALGEVALDRLAPRQVQVIAEPAGLEPALAQTARRLAGRAPGIVFSGGGARALAHLGVLSELSNAGLSFDRVAGVSLGSLVAAAAAAGFSPEAIYETFERGFVHTNPTADFVPPAYSLIRGAKTRRLLG